MARLSLLLLSILLFGGCTMKEIIVIPPSEIYVPSYNDYNVTVQALKKDGKITLSISDFNKRTRQINSLKYHIKATESIVKSYNKTNKELTNEELK